jgi:hypothetical protein
MLARKLVFDGLPFRECTLGSSTWSSPDIGR